MDQIFLHHSTLHITAHLLCFSAIESERMERGRKKICSLSGRAKESTYATPVTIAAKYCQQNNGLTAKLQQYWHSYNLLVATTLRPLTKGKTQDDESPSSRGASHVPPRKSWDTPLGAKPEARVLFESCPLRWRGDHFLHMPTWCQDELSYKVDTNSTQKLGRSSHQPYWITRLLVFRFVC